MKFEILNNSFIEINDLIKIVKIECTLRDYNFENGILKGNLIMQGEYLNNSSSFEKPFNFFKEVPFDILFVEDLHEITKVFVANFEYFEVERRGVEAEVKLCIESSNDRNEINKISELVDDESLINKYDLVKEAAEKSVDNVLQNVFETVVEIDNSEKLPTNTKRTRIRII